MEENNNVINENETTNEGISLKEIWYIIKRNIIFILIFVAIGTIAGFVYSKFIRKPVYTASSTILVQAQASNTSSQYQDYQYSTYLVNTMSDFITNDLIMNKVSKQLLLDEGKLTPEKFVDDSLLTEEDRTLLAAKVKEVKSNTEVKTSSDSLIVTVSYSASIGKGEDEMQTVYICNLIVSTAEEVSNYKKEDDPTKYRFEIFAEKIVKMVSATVPTKSTKMLTCILIGFAAGLVLACAIVFIKYLSDDTFQRKEELEKATGVPVLTFIEGLEKKEVK